MSRIAGVNAFLRRQADLEHGTGATTIEVRELEDAWGGALPEDYAEFLVTFGWAVYGATEIHGLGTDVPGHLDVTTLASSLWTGPARLSQDLLPFYDSGGGWYYCLSKRRSNVVLWALEHGDGQPHDETYENWVSWFHDYFIT